MKTLSKLILILFLSTSTVASIAQTSWTPSSDNTKMFIYPLTTNVGIGTDNPSSKLEVNTNIWQSPLNVSINNESKLYVGHSGNVGIGTNEPSAKLQVNGDILTPEGRIAIGDMYNGNRLNISYSQQYAVGMFDYEPLLVFRAGNTSANTITDVMYLKQNGSIGIGCWPSDSYKLEVGGSSHIQIPTSSSTINAMNIDVASFETTENATNSSFLKLTDVAQSKTAFIVKGNGNVGIGTSCPAYALDVLGTIRAQEIRVDLLGGCDFVFKSDYKLMNLKELDEYVQKNQHLPGIASEKEMIEDGVNMKEFQMQLLQKIEELTLYTIDQDKKIEVLVNEIQAIKKEIAEKK